MAMPYYAEAFAPMVGRCFRMIAPEGEGGPIHCPQLAEWRGTFRARGGRRYLVDSCDGHQDPLIEATQLVPPGRGIKLFNSCLSAHRRHSGLEVVELYQLRP